LTESETKQYKKQRLTG